MTSPYREVTITSIGELVAELTNTYDDNQTVWYRGHREADWKLEPTLARANALEDEKALRAQFQRDAVPLLSKAQIPGTLESDWDWMFLMQHYGVQTRLLDWSESPLIALWFAVHDETSTADSAVWTLLPQKLNAIRSIFPTQPWDLPLCGHDKETDDYTTSGLDDGSPARKLTPLAVLAERRFDRVVAQQGVFTVMHKDRTPIEELGDSSQVTKLTIPASSHSDLRRELARLSITEIALFPDLSRLGALVSRRLK